VRGERNVALNVQMLKLTSDATDNPDVFIKDNTDKISDDILRCSCDTIAHPQWK